MSNVPGTAVLFASVIVLLAGCGGSGEDNKASVATTGVSVQAAPAAGLSGAQGRPVQSAAEEKGADAENLSLKQQVAALRRDVADIRAQLARMPTVASSSEAALFNNRPGETEQREFERAQAARVASVEAAFRAEQVDAAWSRNTADSVRAALLQGKQGGADHIRSIECRSHSCRVMVDSDALQPGGAADLPVLVSRLAQTLPKVDVGQIDQGDNRQVSVLYLSK
ncbi:hypothetical protein [Azohydromonas caseinilytica]|uniref:Uncharacterized protein n=1 Tax=Azohydromonas caseinilytica TaxID=2728836 RepID=A0A848FBY4_9BURK|nr:hypothetical protein [Azohydromonas caseinilytica]NML15481.1 hypothetical protein [Azohydromonas caseinilytica]